MKSVWIPFFASLALASGIIAGCKRSSPASAQTTAAPAIAPTVNSSATDRATLPTTAPSTTQATVTMPMPSVTQTTPSTTNPATAPVVVDGELDRRRRKLLALWDSARPGANAVAEPPLLRDKSGSATEFHSLPDGSSAGATLVTITHAVTARDALLQIARASNARISAESPGMFHTNSASSFSLDLDRKPLLEAIYETCSRAGWTIHSIEPADGSAATQPALSAPAGRIILEPGKRNHGLGEWTTTGPFLFEVVSLEHSVGVPLAGNGDEVQIAIRSWTEPKLRAFNVAGGLSPIAAVDEMGHALLPRQTAGPDYLPGGQSMLRLGLPTDYGRRIARLSLVDHCFIQRMSAVLELKWGDTIESQAVEGMNVSMSTKFDPPFVNRLTLTVARGERSELDWGDLRLAMTNLQPRLLDAAGEAMPFFNSQIKHKDGPLTVEYSWNGNDIHGRRRAAGKIVLDLPTDVKWADVPVEFRDLPLP